MGNILLAVAALIYIGMLFLIYGSYPQTDHSGVAVGWLLILANCGFVLCLAIVSGIIASKGGFLWISPDSTLRAVVVVTGFILIMLGVVFFSLGGTQDDYPAFATSVFVTLPALLPILTLVSAAMLLNEHWRNIVPGAVYKVLLVFILIFGIIAIVLIIMNSAQNAAERMKKEADYETQSHQNYHDIIEATDVMNDMAYILGFTDANHYPDVREHALKKIKSHPNWQEELIRLIRTESAPKVFTFLASNDVNDKEIFAEPIKEGLLMQAKIIRENLRKAIHPSDLSTDSFYWQVERALNTADKFAGPGTDYRSAVEEIKSAFGEPSSLDKPKFRCLPLLADWLKNHG